MATPHCPPAKEIRECEKIRGSGGAVSFISMNFSPVLLAICFLSPVDVSAQNPSAQPVNKAVKNDRASTSKTPAMTPEDVDDMKRATELDARYVREIENMLRDVTPNRQQKFWTAPRLAASAIFLVGLLWGIRVGLNRFARRR